jgi:hypothetical protein
MFFFHFRDHTLHKLMPIIANTPVTGQMYEESTFLRNSSHINYQVSYVKLCASLVAILDFKSTQKMWSTNKTQIWTISNISAIYILHHIHDFLEEI